jgi:hypothetical protein
MRPLVLASLASLLLFSAVPPARACVNDREVDRAEREFKSQYNGKPLRGEPAPEYAPPPAREGGPLAWLGGGSLLLAGACLVCFRRTGVQS